MKAAGRIAVGTILVLTGSLALARKAPASERPARLTQVPAAAGTRTNPLEGNADAVRAGDKLFARHCVECHGVAGEGGGKGPMLRSAHVRTAPAGSLFWVLTHGAVRTGMPVWSKLPEPQRWQIVSYVKSLGPLE